jgi:tetratricopeptide (TPR) repeat protein
MRRMGLTLLLLAASLACIAGEPRDLQRDPVVRSLSGTTLLPPDPVPRQARLEADLAEAQATQAAHPDDPEALIWVGRRLGYLWRYHEAIGVLGEGIERWPDDARLLRHRGHRYITVRDFPRAQADLERAAALITGKPDQIEPDGAPNPAGIPRTTLAYNIHYHLGLARFLQADYSGALAAHERALEVSGNDDALVAAVDWTWMTLMRLGRREEAATLLARITPDMDLLENDGYHRRLRMYQGAEPPGALLDGAGDDATAIATQGYGVANWYLVHGDADAARSVLRRVLAGAGWNAFGYIAAEADLQRLEQVRAGLEDAEAYSSPRRTPGPASWRPGRRAIQSWPLKPR